MQKQAAAIGESSKLTQNEENKINGVNGSNLQNGTKKDTNISYHRWTE